MNPHIFLFRRQEWFISICWKHWEEL